MLIQKIKEFYQTIKERGRDIAVGGAITIVSLLPGCIDSHAGVNATRTEIDSPTSLEQSITDETETFKEMPVLTYIEDINAKEGDKISMMLLATDTNGGGTINYSFTGPFNFQLSDPVNNIYTAQTDFNSAGDYLITVTATNTNGSTNQDVNITIHDLEKVLYEIESVPGSNRDIGIMNSNNSGKELLTYVRGINKDSKFSPDGRKIAYVSNREGQWELYVSLSKDQADEQPIWLSRLNSNILGDSQGDNLERLTQDIHVESKPQWKPTNDALVYQKEITGNPEICTFDLINYIETNLTNNPGDDTDPACSDNYIVWIRDGNVFRMNYNGTGQTQLTFDGTTALPYSKPKISPDETKVLAVKQNTTTDKDLIVMNASDGSAAQDISNNADLDDNASWKSDSSSIIYQSNNDIYTANPDGTNKVQRTTTGDNKNPSWGPSGNSFTFSSSRIGGIWQVFKTTNNGSTYALTKYTEDKESKGWK